MARLQDHPMKNGFLDLQSRLEHLITYSSQLVFVSGDGMSKQRSFAQHFLSHQNELANIGYVDANAKLDIVSYRKKFIQQLVGAVRVDYSKPLTFLIPRLIKDQSEFILIAVTHADLLPDEFLQELWDLVLQNRFAKNRHHLNILVFGEKEWASRAKGWLPANSNNKPVLLANEFVERSVQEPQGMSELDQLISSKRQQFNERMALRESKSTIMSSSMLNKWWVKVVLSLVFFVTFTGILLSQYVTIEQVKSYYASIFDYQPAVSNTNEEQNAPSAAINTDVVSVESINEPIEETVDDKPSFLTLADDQRRVVDWEDAVKSLPKSPIEVSHEASDGIEDESASVDLSQTFESEQLVIDTQETFDEESQLAQAETLIPEANEVEADAFDYPVEDITSVEQLTNLNNGNTEVASLINDGDLSEVEEEAPIEQETTEPEALLSEGEFDAVYLTGLEASRFVLQLSAMSTEEALNFYLQTNQLTETTLIYKTQRFGGDWFVVLHDQTFDSLQSANLAAQELALSTPPFAKSMSNVQQEIRVN
jgi:DamX protein